MSIHLGVFFKLPVKRRDDHDGLPPSLSSALTPFAPHNSYFLKMFSILPNQRIENLPAKNTPHSPEGFARTVESFVSHDSIAPMAIHENSLQRII